MSPLAKDFINALLQVEPKKRLGSQNDYQDILNHPWFKNKDFVYKVLKKEIRPDYIPKYGDESTKSNTTNTTVDISAMLNSSTGSKL